MATTDNAGGGKGAIAARLAALGVTLPEVPTPVGNYVPFVIANGLVFVTQIPLKDGRVLFPGHVPNEVSVEQAREAARQCAINVLAVVRSACAGDLDRIRRCVQLTGFVASAPDFFDQAAVINGASDLMVAALGDAGRHARGAIGASALPLNSPVELQAIFAID